MFTTAGLVGPNIIVAPVGSHAIGVVAPVIAIVAGVLFVRDVGALTRGMMGTASESG